MDKDVLLVIIAINKTVSALYVEPFYGTRNLSCCCWLSAEGESERDGNKREKEREIKNMRETECKQIKFTQVNNKESTYFLLLLLCTYIICIYMCVTKALSYDHLLPYVLTNTLHFSVTTSL